MQRERLLTLQYLRLLGRVIRADFFPSAQVQRGGDFFFRPTIPTESILAFKCTCIQPKGRLELLISFFNKGEVGLFSKREEGHIPNKTAH